MAPERLPFWLPIVAATLSDGRLGGLLGYTSARKVAVLRARYGLQTFPHPLDSPFDVDWPRLLGQVEDELLAQLISRHFAINITSELVALIRSDLGLTPYSSRKRKLEPHVRELVGRYGSANIAKGWDVDGSAVEAYRILAKVELQITGEDDDFPATGRWKAEWISLFPLHTNAQIARATGIPIDAVRQKRKSLRIAAPAGRTYWKLVSAAELDAMTDEALASRFGGPTADYSAQRLSLALQDSTLRQRVLLERRLPSELAHFLSKMPTRRLAKLTGLSEFHLTRQRQELSLKPFSKLTPELDELLSTRPDTELAEQFHVAVATVRSRREKLGKPAFKPAKRRPSP
ncbi:TPA: hypothetical protein L4R50_000194 [Pseudomonas aeruginosa]|nr:hypothetical protein [Pseudomonas aeruginosa]